MESLMYMASGTLAITKIIQKCLDASTTWRATSSTGEMPQVLTNHKSENVFQPRTRFDIDTQHVSSPFINVDELETTPCKNSNECRALYGDGFSCTLIERPLRLHINIEGVQKTIHFGVSSNSNIKKKDEGLNCKRCVPTSGSEHILKCNALTSIAVCSATYSPQTKRFKAHWVCENLYPQMFSEDPTTGDITICHTCGAAENRGQLIHKNTGLSWDEHYKLHGIYDPVDSLVCECYPFPFKPEDMAANRSLYSGNILRFPPTTNCMRSNCAPGRPHSSDPRSCECPPGHVSCPVSVLGDKEEFHRQLCWGSFIRDKRGYPMPSCVRDPCMPHAKLDVGTGQCVAESDAVAILTDTTLFPKATWGVPIKRGHTFICGSDFEAPLKRKNFVNLNLPTLP